MTGTGILLCGLNGAGKSTLGRVLAEKLHFHFIDNEDLYFPKTDPMYPYAFSRSREEVERLLFQEIETHKNFIYTSVTGNYGDAEKPFFQYVVWVEVPRELRLQRIRDRSFQKFGDRVLPGGALYEKENQFFEFAKARPEDMVARWVQSLSCPVIRVDGTKPVEENAAFIAGQIRR